MSWGVFGLAAAVVLLLAASGRRRAAVAVGVLVIAVDLFPWLPMRAAVLLLPVGAVAVVVGGVLVLVLRRVSRPFPVPAECTSDEGDSDE